MLFSGFIKFLVILIGYVIFIFAHEPIKSNGKIPFKLEKSDENELNKKFKIRLREYEKDHENYNFEKKKLSSSEFEKYKNYIKEVIMDRAAVFIPGAQQLQLLQMARKKNKFSFLDLKRSFPIKDDPVKWFQGSYEKNINKFPLSGTCERKPWSGSYWPMRNGLISVRYCMNEKNTVGKVNSDAIGYLETYKYKESVKKYLQPAEHQFQIQFNYSYYENYIDSYYSPSEKYDLLIGDYDFTLTNKMKQEGNSHLTNGDIPTWFGICHGWSPAAYIFQRPKHPVNITNPDGITIRFLPDDIKALASLFIANAYVRTYFLGDVCRVYKPNTPSADNATGLYLDPRCHALNPGSLITVLANDIGKNRKNFNLDPDADPEIWNQPVNGYILRYYNLITQDFSSDPTKVKIPIRFLQGSSDKFLNYLARMAGKTSKYVVGAYINITYTLETTANHNVKDWDDINKTIESIGAIELDENDNVVGGEWKYNSHPNFIWRLDEKTKLEGCCDGIIKEFTGKVTKDVTKWGIQASSRKQVLKSIVDYIVNQSITNITEPEIDYSHRWDFLFE